MAEKSDELEDLRTLEKRASFDARELKTHGLVDRSLCGDLIEIEEGYAKTKLETTRGMLADNEGLIHTGFVFSAANFVAMAAVNEPFMILSGAKVEFLAPIEYGDIIEFEALVKHKESRKRVVTVVGKTLNVKVFEGKFTTVILNNHILDLKLKKRDVELPKHELG
jgi:acyl-coenzyme A thioesterase PaaI-like protein